MFNIFAYDGETAAVLHKTLQ